MLSPFLSRHKQGIKSAFTLHSADFLSLSATCSNHKIKVFFQTFIAFLSRPTMRTAFSPIGRNTVPFVSNPITAFYCPVQNVPSICSNLLFINTQNCSNIRHITYSFDKSFSFIIYKHIRNTARNPKYFTSIQRFNRNSHKHSIPYT